MLLECPIESCYVLALARNFGFLAKNTLAGGRSDSIVTVDVKRVRKDEV